MKHAYIARHVGAYPTRLMCQVLGVAPAGFYAAQRRELSPRARTDLQLRVALRAAHAASQRRYGRPKLLAELRAQGWCCGPKRIARLMRLDGLRAKRVRAFRVTTRSTHQHWVAANHLARQFAVGRYSARDRAWAADITYVPTRAGWIYLAVILDLASRRVIGWHVAPRLTEELALAALRMALARRRPPPGAVHHSDRGVQYASAAYQQVLAQHGFVCSMSRVGDCWDNAVVESFFATLKTELVAGARWPTREAAHRALATYLEDWYNCRRRHASLGYCTPADYERTSLKPNHAA